MSRCSIWARWALPEPGRPLEPLSPLERLLSRDTLIVGAALATAILLAWAWLVGMAAAPAGMAPGGGMDGMAGMDMPGMAAAVDPWSPAYLGAAFLMWLLMMVAMMLPSAAPMILFYARFARRSGGAAGRALLFAAVYVAIWAGFSAGAVLLQALLVDRGAVSAVGLALGEARLAGALLLLAALYQLTPLKRACLAACRSPLDFLMRGWRPGVAGALRLGARHGFYCLGCCWALMLLLFVGGVMNLAWIAALALIVMAEKLAPPRWRVDLAVAALLLAGGLFLMLR